MKFLFKLLKLIYSIIQTAVISLAVVLIGLYLYGIRPYIVQTGSMEPEIPTGSVCFVNHRADFDSVKAGDIIAFKAGEMMVTHRVVSIDENGFQTKGDANNTEDTSPVTAENFIGMTIFWIPSVGIYVSLIRTKYGIIVFVSGAVMFLLMGHLLDKAEPKQTIQGDEDV